MQSQTSFNKLSKDLKEIITTTKNQNNHMFYIKSKLSYLSNIISTGLDNTEKVLSYSFYALINHITLLTKLSIKKYKVIKHKLVKPDYDDIENLKFYLLNIKDNQILKEYIYHSNKKIIMNLVLNDYIKEDTLIKLYKIQLKIQEERFFYLLSQVIKDKNNISVDIKNELDLMIHSIDS